MSDFAASNTFFAGDVIDGKGGIDTFNLITGGNAGATAIIGSNFKNVEKINVTATGAAQAVTFNAVTGLTDLVNTGSTFGLTFGGGASATSVANIVNLSVAGASAATTLTYSDSVLTGSADVQNVSLNGYGSGTTQRALTIGAFTAATNQLETLNLSVTGTNGITLTTDGTQTSLKNLNITGSGNVAIDLAADNIRTSATIIDANAATGNILIGGDTGTTGDAGGNVLGAAAHKVTLGGGNDAVFFGANLNSSDTVIGGAGTDVLGLTAAIGSTAAATNTAMTNVSGIEVIRFDAGAALTQDAGASSLAGMSYQLVSAAQTYTLNNLANSASVTVLGGAAATTAVTLALKDSSGLNDALSVAINNGASNAATTVTTLTDVTGLETLNLSSAGGTGTNVITTLGATGKVVLTGSAGLTITNALATTSFDGNAFTGKLSTKLGAATNTNIASGSGADTITTGTGSDTVNTGAGNDLIINGTAVNDNTGADVLFGGAGNDTFQLQGGTVAANLTNYSTVLSIKDFTVGSSTSATDFIALSGSAVYGGTALTVGTSAAASVATGDAVVAQSLAQNATAAISGATVNLIKLSTGVAFTTNFQSTFNAAIGTGSITGLHAAGGGYLVSMYDTTNSKAVLLNVDSTTAGATSIATGDAVTVIGSIDMTAADYANFGAINFAVFVA